MKGKGGGAGGGVGEQSTGGQYIDNREATVGSVFTLKNVGSFNHREYILDESFLVQIQPQA